MPITLRRLQKPDLNRSGPLRSQLITEKFQFKPHLTSLCLTGTLFTIRLVLNRYSGQYFSYASVQVVAHEDCNSIYKMFSVSK